MELIDLLKQLAEKYPEKWWWQYERTCSWLHAENNGECVYFRDDSDGEELIWTEDMDAILAEHGLVMWVSPSVGEGNYLLEQWWGGVCGLDGYTKRPHPVFRYSTKREATLATFQAALEYILEDKP